MFTRKLKGRRLTWINF